MKQLKLPVVFLIATCLLVPILQVIETSKIQLNDDSSIFESLRLKRQASRGQAALPKQQSPNQKGQANSMSIASMSAASGNSKNTNVKPNDEPIEGNEEEIATRPEDNLDNKERPVANQPPHRSKKPIRRPVNHHRQDDGEDCYDDNYNRDYDDYGADFFQMATRPMRQFGRIMSDVLNGMPMRDMNYDSGGASVASSASSINDGDGYSRSSSSVTNNGKTRGIVSETRNGRTQTRRIERNNDEEAENQPSVYYDDE